MSNIKRLKDKDGNYIYPVTHTSAVFDDNGIPLKDMLDNLSISGNDAYLIDLNKPDDIDMSSFLQLQIDKAYEDGYSKVIFPKNSYIELYNETNCVAPNSTYRATYLSLKSNTIYDLNGSVLKVKPNNYAGYYVLDLKNIENTVVMNGTLRGDRDKHEYIEGSTSEWGRGLYFQGSKLCVAKNLIIEDMTGDGAYMGGYLSTPYKRTPPTMLKMGKLNVATGDVVESTEGYYCEEFIDIAALLDNTDIAGGCSMNDGIFLFPVVNSGLGPLGQFKRRDVNLYFYDADKKLIVVQQGLLSGYNSIPEGSAFMRYSFDNIDLSQSDGTQAMVYKIGRVTENSMITNCYIHNCRRQGVSISRCLNSGVYNCTIENIQGTAPESCIDIEDGGHATVRIQICNNILRQSRYGVVCYDGHNHIISSNTITGCNVALTINAPDVITIDKNYILNGDVMLQNNKDYNGYKPVTFAFENNVLMNNKDVFITGRVLCRGNTMINTTRLEVKNRAHMVDTDIWNDRTANSDINFSSSFIEYVRVECAETNKVTFKTEYSQFKKCEFINTSVLCSFTNTFSDCIIGQYKAKHSTDEEVYLEFTDCVLGSDTLNGWALTSIPSNKAKFTFTRCKFNFPIKANNYGMLPLGPKSDVRLYDCDIVFNNQYKALFYNTANGVYTDTIVILENCNVISDTTFSLTFNTSNLPNYIVKNCTNINVSNNPNFVGNHFIGYTNYNTDTNKLQLYVGGGVWKNIPFID